MTVFTEELGLFGVRSASEAVVIANILAQPTGAYTAHDIGRIVSAYFRYCSAVMLDPVLVLAQVVHETGNFSSWWAARPRRNPAGIGVNGQKVVAAPADTTGWAFDAEAKLWKKGCRFESWEDRSVPAHVGRLLAYLLPPKTGSAMQRAMIDLALTLHPLDPRVRGTVRVLRQLGQRHNPSGLGWAKPGTIYGRQIAAVAQRLVALPPVAVAQRLAAQPPA